MDRERLAKLARAQGLTVNPDMQQARGFSGDIPVNLRWEQVQSAHEDDLPRTHTTAEAPAPGIPEELRLSRRGVFGRIGAALFSGGSVFGEPALDRSFTASGPGIEFLSHPAIREALDAVSDAWDVQVRYGDVTVVFEGGPEAGLRDRVDRVGRLALALSEVLRSS